MNTIDILYNGVNFRLREALESLIRRNEEERKKLQDEINWQERKYHASLADQKSHYMPVQLDNEGGELLAYDSDQHLQTEVKSVTVNKKAFTDPLRIFDDYRVNNFQTNLFNEDFLKSRRKAE